MVKYLGSGLAGLRPPRQIPRMALVGCLMLIGLGGAAEPEAKASPRGGSIVDVLVAFGVRNSNDSGVPCASDQAPYTVRGRLVAPRSALEAPRPRAVTVYLHGFNVGAFMWQVPGFPELDHPLAMAKRGHASVVVDRLGYDASDHPHGWLTCLGAQADVTRQLVDALRGGEYAVEDGKRVAFQKVVLAGHDSGATIADIVAYSYPGAIDGLVHFNWADQGFSETAQNGYFELLPECAAGGKKAEQGPPARDDPAGGPLGYAQFLTDEQIRERQFNTDPEVIARLMRLWNRIPCGEMVPVPEVAQVNIQRLPQIRIPVLYGYAEHEFVWTEEGLVQQAGHYRNSPDLTTVVIQDAGHFPTFSRVAESFRAAISNWLRTRGFGGHTASVGRDGH